MKLWQTNKLKRINLLEGSVSSGKTWISLVLWAFWVKEMPEDKLYMMCAKSLTTLKRNCLILLQELVGEDNFQFSISSKEGYLFNRKILLEGANDARSESKIRGLTLQGAYCDELTQFPQDFFAMLLSRLRVPGAKLVATTNPDSPLHWLKTEYIDRQEELSFLDMSFLIDDNTTLPADYVENLKREYTGVFYERFIRGKWALAQGVVYSDIFETQRHVTEEEFEFSPVYYVSCDYGTQNATVFLLWHRIKDGRWLCEKEYYYSGRTQIKQKTDEQYCDDLQAFIGDIRIQGMIVDPSAASFIAALRKRGICVIQAKNDVLDGIRFTASLLNRNQIFFRPCCTNTIQEFGVYSWKPYKPGMDTDEVIKENDHCMDAMRYFCYTVLAVNKVGTSKLRG
jgi:PBSX family phage terminase large subunit